MVAAILGFAEGFAEASIEEDIEAKTLTVLASKDTADIEAIVVAIRY
jgi:hypothetical protein